MSGRTKLKSYSNLKKQQIFLSDAHLKNEVDFERSEAYRLETENFTLDYSKIHLDDKALDLLKKYAMDCEITGNLEKMLTGERVNISENLPALHHAWRASETEDIRFDGRSVMTEIIETRNQMKTFCQKVEAGEIVGKTGERFLDIIHLGLGGSLLSVKLATQALKKHKRPGIGLYFVETLDGSEIQEIKSRLRPETTLVVIASKSFRTRETLLSASYMKEWFDDELGTGAYRQHMIGATANIKNAHQFGLLEDYVFSFKNWVVGRYGSFSPTMITLPLYCGWSVYERFCQGAESVDKTMKKTVISDTTAYKLAIISFWYRVFWQTTTEGIFSYTKELEGLKDHLQILSYESNGKPSSIPTAPFMYGGVGTGVEHQFFQKIQQVPEKTLSTFVITEKPIDEGHNELHRALNAHALGFSEALATGNQTKEPEAFCEGNQPSLLLVMKKLTPENLGALIAIYEYKTIIESLLYGVNAFEGYGVIPGKNTVQNILQGQLPALQSTIHWVKKWGYFQENKKKSPSE